MNRLIIFTLLFGLGTLGFSSLNIEAQNKENQVAEERLFVHTDRDIYVAGENVFFNVCISSSDSISNKYSKVCYLVLRDIKHTFIKLCIKINKKDAFGSFYLPDTLKTGNYEVVVFTNYMRNFGESVYYRKTLIVVNRFDEWLNNLFQSAGSINSNNDTTVFNSQESVDSPVKIVLAKDSFKVRDKIQVGIVLKDPSHDHVKGNLTVSVKELNPYTRFQILGDTNHFPQHGVAPVPKTMNYPMEENGIYINGEIMTIDSVPVQNECLFLSTPDSIPNLQYAYSDHQGRFQFYVSNYYLGKKLIILAKNDRKGNTVIRLDDKFQLDQAFEPKLFGLTREFRKYILESQKLVKVQKAYSTKNTKIIDVIRNDITIPYVYRSPSTIVLPSDYVPLKGFQEISENILNGMRLKTEDNKYKAYIINYLTMLFFQEPASLFLDGVPVYNLNTIMNLGTPDIIRIEMCKTPRIKGELEFSGIVSITTREKINDYSFLPGSFTFTMEKFVDNTIYDPPQYNHTIISDPGPDFRQLLCWDPVFLMNAGNNSVEFYASDWPADYIIEVTGLNQDGIPFANYSKIKVYR